MQHANLLETLENVIPDDMLLRIAPALTPSPSLSSLRESAAARFQNENVSGSDDEKPEPLSQSPPADSTSSPSRGVSARGANASADKRHSMWAGSGTKSESAAASSMRRLSLSQVSALQQFTATGGGHSNSPSSVTVSPVAQQLQNQSTAPAHSGISPRNAALFNRNPARSSLSIPQALPRNSVSVHHVQFHQQSDGKLQSTAEDDEYAESLENMQAEVASDTTYSTGARKQTLQAGSNSASAAGGSRRQSWAAAAGARDSRAAAASLPVQATLVSSSGAKGSKRRSLF